jgi:hypothetical protein
VSISRYAGRVSASQIFWLVLACTLVAAMFGGRSVFGYRLSGLAGWVIPLIVALMAVVGPRGRVAFPYQLWMPWLLFVGVYQTFAEAENAFQRSVMLVVPVVIGIATSKVSVSQADLERLLVLCKWFAGAFLIVALAKTGIGETGRLPGTSGIAPEAITISLLCALFAASYSCGRKAYLGWWAVAALVPVIGLTRGPLVACALTLPLTLAPIKPLTRLAVFIAVVAGGLLLFHTERVQQRMFYSGEGTLLDMRLDNPDFQTSGRARIIEEMEVGIEEAPWFGHGANASQEILGEIAEGLEHPHNDWLRIAYDYGYLGALLFALVVCLQVWHARRAAQLAVGAERVLFYAGAGAFVPMVLLMLTDNIVLYAAYFGNLHFALLGLAYAARRDRIQASFHRLSPGYVLRTDAGNARRRSWLPFRS